MNKQEKIWDMGKQARQVEILTLIVFTVLLATCLWLLNFQFALTVPSEQGRQVIARVNIFELLVSKK